MKRRNFNLLAGASFAGASFSGLICGRAFAQAADASQLGLTLTPFGAERAGNAAGTIPAWTGGMTVVPAGISWDPNATLPPDFWADEQPLYEVNPENMAQYEALLTDGVKFQIQNKGMNLKVYPTHRTASAPQWVYDNAAANVTRAVLNPNGGRLGYTGAYGGIPFPILDTSDPYKAGAQAVWNHESRWGGSYLEQVSSTFVVIGGVRSLAQVSRAAFIYPFYQKGGSPSTYDGYLYKVGGPGQFAPANVAGDQTINYTSSNPIATPNVTWQLLAGQGRVRKAPEVEYDTPSTYADGICNYDEYYGFNGALNEYDWKLLGKQEMLVPYNNNKLANTPSAVAHGPKFINPDAMRWELHRVWVVEATLHPGERNVLARRKLYIDEDTWQAMIIDSWDAKGNIFHHGFTVNGVFPNLPGTIFTNVIVNNLQTGNYVSVTGAWGDAPYNAAWTFDPVPPSTFNPQTMAAAANY